VSAKLGIHLEGAAELAEALGNGAVSMEDMHTTFGDIALRMARLAAGFAPYRQGHLRQSIQAEHSGFYASVTAQAVYAGVINYGWPRRNITASRFMQRASAAMEHEVEPMVAKGVAKILRRRGLA
jgi:hypothetical protein